MRQRQQFAAMLTQLERALGKTLSSEEIAQLELALNAATIVRQEGEK